MIKSMTGFGRAEAVTKEWKITVELKSVNHRYLDLNIKMPRKLNLFEGQVRNLMKTYMQRGKVDVFITYEDYTAGSVALKYNRDLAAEYLGYFKEMEEEFQLKNDIGVSALSRYPEVLTMEEQPVNEEKLWTCLEGPLHEACRRFVDTRETEGRNLKNDLLTKLDALDEKVSAVEARSPEVVQAYREKLEAKVHELLEDSQIDDNRIAAEVVIYSDKICNDEETVRLHSHIRGMKKILTEKRRRKSVAKLINVGFGNVVNSQKIVAVVSPDAAPVKRMVQSIKGTRALVDATQGRKTKAVIVTSDDYVVLSALQPETIARRFAEAYDYEERGEEHE